MDVYKERNMKPFRIAVLRAKGQITIPKEIREHLKLKTGDSVIFSIEENGELVVSKGVTVLTAIYDAIRPKESKS